MSHHSDWVGAVKAAGIPQLDRGRVWCIQCGHTRKVDSADCFRKGWPKCCGETMTIDSPEEREEFQQRKENPS